MDILEAQILCNPLAVAYLEKVLKAEKCCRYAASVSFLAVIRSTYSNGQNTACTLSHRRQNNKKKK